MPSSSFTPAQHKLSLIPVVIDGNKCESQLMCVPYLFCLKHWPYIFGLKIDSTGRGINLVLSISRGQKTSAVIYWQEIEKLKLRLPQREWLMLPLEGHYNFWLRTWWRVSPCWFTHKKINMLAGGRGSCKFWDNFAQLQLLNMKRVEKIPASHVADAFHLSQREAECKNTALFVEALTSACLHGGTRLRLSPAPPHLPCQLGCPPQLLHGQSPVQPCQFASTGSDACDGEE